MGMAMRLAGRGKAVVAEMSASSALSAVDRMGDMGLYDGLVASGLLSGVVYQRLLRRLCGGCSVTLEEAVEAGGVPSLLQGTLRDRFGRRCGGIRAPRAGGCAGCRGTGWSGRVLCSETLVPDPDFLSLMEARLRVPPAERTWGSTGAVWDRMEAWGFVGIQEHACRLMLAGDVCPVDVDERMGELWQLTPAALARLAVPEGGL